jgi:molybdate transport system permease protein
LSDAEFRQALTTGAALPRWIYIPAAVGAMFMVLPLVAVTAKVDRSSGR